MIQTVAEFLQALMEKEREKLPEFKEIQHPGIFGEMYEGLTQDLLKRALFQGFDLRIVRGKVRNAKGTLSREIDCMVVYGDGEPIPYTNKFIYPYERVVMIVEIKKTLYGDDLNDAFDLFHHFWREVYQERTIRRGIVEDAWRALFKTNLPMGGQVDGLSLNHQTIRLSLLTEAELPVRVIFGYDGYVDEYGLREGIVTFLKQIAQQPSDQRLRFNINTFPNLIVCRQASVIKLNGMPYSGMMDSGDFWCCMGSRKSAPFYCLLEVLWTRLVEIFDLGPEIFGEDLDIETINPLLSARVVKKDELTGWEYRAYPMTRENLKESTDSVKWEPPTLTGPEFYVMNLLCIKGEVDISDPDLCTLLHDNGQTIHELIRSLNEKNLAAREGRKLKLITDQCLCGVLPDGRFTAAENKSGRLFRYGLKLVEQLRRGKIKEANRSQKETGSSNT